MTRDELKLRVRRIKIQSMTIDIKHVGNRSRQLHNFRVASVGVLAKARQRVNVLQAQLVEAQREDKKAYVRTTKNGWSEDELKKLGLEVSAAARRRRKASTPTQDISFEDSTSE